MCGQAQSELRARNAAETIPVWPGLSKPASAQSVDCCAAQSRLLSNLAEFGSISLERVLSSEGETRPMSTQTPLAELEKRHQALEQEIKEALAHPARDDLKIAELKRRKLLVKDEIARLKHAASVH